MAASGHLEPWCINGETQTKNQQMQMGSVPQLASGFFQYARIMAYTRAWATHHRTATCLTRCNEHAFSRCWHFECVGLTMHQWLHGCALSFGVVS